MGSAGVRLGLATSLLFATVPALADCPSSHNPSQPYRVTTANSSADVLRLDSGDTREVARFNGGSTLEKTLYAGLILTEHVANGRRTIFKPRTDLKKLFPLKIGQAYQIDFDTQEPDGGTRLFRTEYKGLLAVPSG